MDKLMDRQRLLAILLFFFFFLFCCGFHQQILYTYTSRTQVVTSGKQKKKNTNIFSVFPSSSIMQVVPLVCA